jgi:hypothetical protein
MKRYWLRFSWALAATLLLTACATVGPPQPPSLKLPKPPLDLRAVRKGDRVILTWTIPSVTTDRQTIQSSGPARICRGLIGAGGSAKKKPTASYIDKLPPQLESDSSSSFATYAVEVLNSDGRGAGLSNRVKVPLFRTPPAPQDFRADVTSQGVVLIWTGSSLSAPTDAHYVYRVYRSGEKQPVLVGEVPIGNETRFALTDSEIDWGKTYQYRCEAVAVVGDPAKPSLQVEGDDTPEIEVFAKDIFPPAVPSGLQAVFSGPGQQPFIDLVWAPVTDADLAGYNVYRHVEGTPPSRLNVEPVKTPTYRDTNVEPAKRYIYSVSAVDLRGNESAQSETASELVPAF